MNFAFAENFDWTLPNKRAANNKVKSPEGIVVYSHEYYAQELIKLMFSGDTQRFDSIGKDLEEGNVYICRITNISETQALAQTATGQSIYIDIKKELKDAERLGIENIQFNIGSDIKATVRKIGGGYMGSVVDYYMQSIRVELFEQIKEGKHAYRAKIEEINKGGYICNISGIKCFLPGSLAAANRITDFESYIGREIPVMMEGYVEAKDIFIVSYKKYLNKIMYSKIQELDLTKKYKGCVTGTSEFGVFVEWDEVYTGLIHKTEFQDDQVLVSFTPGTEIEFYVKEIKENNRLTLTLEKPLERNVILSDLDNKIKNGTIDPMESKVKHRRKNGILVEILPFNLMALIPQEKTGKKEKNLKPGDSLMVSVYSVELSTGKIFAEPINE